MAEWRPNDDNISDSEDEESGFDIKGREAIVFVVDAFLLEENNHFQNAIKLIRDALLSGLIVNNKDLIGIIFTNTKESPPPKEAEALKNIVVPKNCSLFLPLRQLNKDIVEYYLNFMEDNCCNFESTYGVSHGTFTNMIRLCGNMFQQCGVKLSTQTIVYFTDREIPHSADTHEFQRAIQKATELEGLGVEFTLIPMRDDFDFEPFYKEFLSLVKDLDMESFVPPDPRLSREMIADRKLKLDANKRCLGHVMWNLGSNLEISTKYYNYFQKSVYPKRVHLKREDNSLITAKIENYIAEKDPVSGEILNKREMCTEDKVYALSSGNEEIQVSESEMLSIQYPYKPILKLIGFKDLSSIKRDDFIRPCSFLYPDEGRISGSTKLFTTLWQRCLVKEKIAVCVFIPRKKSTPSYVALVPVTSDDKDETNTRTFMNGDGFKIVFLPLARDYRYFDLKEWNVNVNPSEDGEILIKKITKKFKVKYIPSTIKDPALDELQCKLLELAFDIKTEGGGKFQMPSGQKQDERIESYLDDFTSIFGVEETAATAKRAVPASAGENGSPAKKPKLSEANVSTTTIDTLIATNKLSDLSKDQLYSYLKGNNLKATKSMAKQLLVEQILKFRRDAHK